ncbi:DUF6368 family protein [Streptomyces sp. NPDC046925]|uniref:DUF6368 family protein n=1 Tax=Streptomyces sp. NPDC046925 TaxID=3155375 RepID=UPI0033C5CC10
MLGQADVDREPPGLLHRRRGPARDDPAVDPRPHDLRIHATSARNRCLWIRNITSAATCAGAATSSTYSTRCLRTVRGAPSRSAEVVSLMGPGFGDESVFAAEHADEVDQEPLIGFTPTHAVDVIAFCSSQVDHVVTARLTAVIMDVIGGVAGAELREDQVPVVAGLPGVLGTTTDPWAAAYGSAEFLRAWADAPGFRLLK